MTPLQAAKAHCANYQPDGTCLGVDIKDDGSLTRFQPAGRKCLLATAGQRCPYFEQCVMPMEIREWKSPLEQKDFAQAVYTYRIAADVSRQEKGKRICPTCNCRPLEPRKKYCYVCAEASRREATRERVDRLRTGRESAKPAAATDQPQTANP